MSWGQGSGLGGCRGQGSGFGGGGSRRGTTGGLGAFFISLHLLSHLFLHPDRLLSLFQQLVCGVCIGDLVALFSNELAQVRFASFGFAHKLDVQHAQIKQRIGVVLFLFEQPYKLSSLLLLIRFFGLVSAEKFVHLFMTRSLLSTARIF